MGKQEEKIDDRSSPFARENRQYVNRRSEMRRIILTLGLVLFTSVFLFAQEQKDEEISLTLMDCILKALKDNIDITIDAYNPDISEFAVKRSRETFMPQLNLGYETNSNNQLSNWFVQGTAYTTERRNYSVGLSQDLVTGGQISLSMSNTATDTTQALVTINPSYYGSLTINFSQPLLKNFGPKINRRSIRQAKNQRDISVFGLKSTLIQKVYEVEEAYWNLVRAIENLKVQEFSLEKSRDRLKRNVEAARIGSKTELDVLESRTQVASGEDNIIASRASVETYIDRLRNLINLPVGNSEKPQAIAPLDEATVEKVQISFEQALRTAFEERPELSRFQKEIENKNIDISYYKNQLLPQLDLDFRLWYPGQSGDRLIYLNNDPFTGIIVDRIEGSRADSMKDVFGFKYDNWTLQFNLTIPLENILSRASLAEAKLQKEQKLLEQEREEISIHQELIEVFKELENREKRIETSRQYRELMEKRLEAEEEKYRLGIGSSEWLFTYQERLVSAKRAEINAVIDYKISVAKLERILGINLKTKDLKYRNYDF